MTYETKCNIAAGTWLVTTALFVYLFLNGYVPDNIWSSSNYFVIVLFVINGISLFLSFIYFIAGPRI